MSADYTGDSSFSGVPFLCEETGPLARADFPVQRAQSIRHVPWGNRTIVQDLGREPTALTLRLIVEDDQIAALESRVMTLGTLALVDAPARSNVLIFLSATFLGL